MWSWVMVLALVAGVLGWLGFGLLQGVMALVAQVLSGLVLLVGLLSAWSGCRRGKIS